MASRHLPALVAAVLSGVVVVTAGLATSDGDDASTETASEVTSTTTEEPRPTTTSRDVATTSTSTSESTTTTAAPVESTTTAPPTTATTRPPAPPSTAAPTTAAPTTAPAPAQFVIASGPTPPSVAGCGGSTQVRVRNVGGSPGAYALQPSEPSWVSVSSTQFALDPGGESTATILVKHNGPADFTVDLVEQSTGVVAQTFLVGITKTPGFPDPDCQRP